MAAFGHLTLFIFICIVSHLLDNGECSNPIDEITVATYNVWNVMFNWDVRKFRITQMVREVDPHIVAFQELRSTDDQLDPEEVLSQLSDLQQLLPRYRWKQYSRAHSVEHMKGTYIKEWNHEGIGILSRLPIVRHREVNLTTNGGPDTNNRVALHVSLLLDQSTDPDTSKIVDVVVVHFSYDRQQQCSNAVDVFRHINEKQLTKTIVLGDFNTYKDNEIPIEVFTRNSSNIHCKPSPKQPGDAAVPSQRHVVFKDSWVEANPVKSGLTFSNMPQPGLESRPDRILYSTSSFQVQSANLKGDGSTYRSRFFYQVLWSRVEAVLGASYDSYIGQTGRSCIHDCGPHASCRCGVCVSGGDGNACNLPDCHECSSRMFCTLIIFLLIFLLLLAQLIFGILQVLLTLNERGRSRFSYHQPESAKSNIPCCSACICDARLYSNVNAKLRSIKRRKLCQLWPLLRLPPMMLVIVTVVIMYIIGEFMLYAFKDAISDVYSIIPEELNPSDHLLLYATFGIKSN